MDKTTRLAKVVENIMKFLRDFGFDSFEYPDGFDMFNGEVEINQSIVCLADGFPFNTSTFKKDSPERKALEAIEDELIALNFDRFHIYLALGDKK